jgi:putative hydrolase of the HAD superfamily
VARARLTLRAVLFDVDFTLARPGPELGPEGYRRAGERCGLELDTSLYEAARTTALDRVQRRADLVHDEEIWVAFTEEIVRGMGGDPSRARACALELTRAWERSENFDLYEDALPVLEELRRHGLKLGIVSNGARDVEEFLAHHTLSVDVAIASRAHGRTKPHPSIFQAALARLEVAPAEAAMVGDSLEDDVEGARAVGIRAFLIDRDGRFPDESDRLADLYALPAALGLPRPG